jgi:hypothetical protein
MMTTTRQRGRMSLALSLILALALAIPAQHVRADANPNPGVIPIGARPLGMTYGQWGAAWWQYVFSIPVHDPAHPGQFLNPLLDTTGINCAVGQANNPVFFLAGVFSLSGGSLNATRSCTVPAGKMLFFPILNVEGDNECSTPLTVPALQAQAKASMDAVTADELEADIDGEPVSNLLSYRAASPGAFSVNFPADSIADYVGCQLNPGAYYPFVSDGYWLMLHPLSAGQHTIHFKGGNPAAFHLDITYHLTVSG